MVKKLKRKANKQSSMIAADAQSLGWRHFNVLIRSRVDFNYRVSDRPPIEKAKSPDSLIFNQIWRRRHRKRALPRRVSPYSFCPLSINSRKTAMASRYPPSVAFKIILGSASVARRNILTEMGYEFEIMTADIDEKGIRREKPEELVMVLAEAKADAIISRMKIADFRDEGTEATLLITSDIVVVHEGIIREKPTTKEEARQFLKGYSGGHVSTVGSVVVTNLKTGRRCGGLDIAEVYFHDIPDEIIESLIDEGIVFNVAGGLLLEHPLTLPFVEQVVGATDSVMGLPKALTEKLIHEALLPPSK
ncbi:uncharacterized protein [Typha latifolia]|uniref:uncharacterized protein isoform X2 n=2 Tax=Typha latifolia TaxID=4733 RepID=UPI003C2C1929